MTAEQKELRRKWVEALRSGEYKQGQGLLRSSVGYCCLGVACVVAGIPISDDGSITTSKAGEGTGYDPILKVFDLSAKESQELWHRNDGVGGRKQHTFLEIADYIESLDGTQ